MPRIYTPSLNIGPGKRVGTAYGSSGITGHSPNIVRGLGRNDRSQPFTANSVPTNLYFDIFRSTITTVQTFNYVFVLTENVASIEIRTGSAGSLTNTNLYTPSLTSGIRLNNGPGRNTGTNRNVYMLNVTGSGTVVELRIQTRENNSYPFYIYAAYFMNDMLLDLKNDEKTSFSSYNAISTPRNGVLQTDLFGTETYQHSVNLSDRRQLNFTTWRVDDELILIDRWIDTITRTRQQYPNIILEEGFLTNYNQGTDSYTLDTESHNLENVYPATWSTAIRDQIEGSGAKSINFRFQQS